ncbi:MAG: TetR/AcrR family transcriptional regulator [Candidatus Fimivivens sp.]
MENPQRKPLQAPKSMIELDAYFLHMHKVVQDADFYFWHHAQLAQLSPKIKDAQKQAYSDNFDRLYESFRTLQTDGLFREERYAREYKRTINTLYLSIIYWLPFCELSADDDAKSGEGLREQVWGIVYPHLTGKSWQTLKEIMGC